MRRRCALRRPSRWNDIWAYRGRDKNQNPTARKAAAAALLSWVWGKNVVVLALNDFSIHCSFDDPWRAQGTLQTGDERLYVHASSCAFISKRLPHRLRPYLRRRVFFDRCLVKEHKEYKPSRMCLHGGQVVPDPRLAPLFHMCP